MENKRDQAKANASFSFSIKVSKPDLFAFLSAGSGIMSDSGKTKKRKNPRKKGKK